MNPTKNSKSGVTLVEVMVSSTLLLIFLTAAGGVLVATSTSLELVRQRTTATALAWSRVERARFMDFGLIGQLQEDPPGTRINAAGVPDEQGHFRRRTHITITTNGLPMANIHVRVWAMERRTGEFTGQPEEVQTVITQISPFGSEP